MVGTYVKAEQEKAGNKRAIAPADLVTSQLNLAMEAAGVQHCAVANLEMHPMDTSRTRHFVYSCCDEPEDSPERNRGRHGKSRQRMGTEDGPQSLLPM